MNAPHHPTPRPLLRLLPPVLALALGACSPDASASQGGDAAAADAGGARGDIRDLVNALTPVSAEAGPSEQRAWYVTRKRTLEHLVTLGRPWGEEALRMYQERPHAIPEVRAGLLEVAAANAPDLVEDLLVELVTTFGDEMLVRTQAAEFLGRDCPERAVEVLGPILDGSYDGRTFPPADQLLEAWVVAMGRLERDPVPLLAELATDLNQPQEVRHLATQTLGDFPGPRSRQALEQLLVESTYNSYVRRKAAQALRRSLEQAEFCTLIRGIIEREADPIFQVFLDNMLTDACR